MEERRQFVRLDARLPVSYRLLPASQQPRPSTTTNVGGGGVCVFVDETVQLGAFLQVEIALPERGHPISFLGQVVWCQPVVTHTKHPGGAASHRSVMAGVKCIQILPEDQEEITRHVIQSLKPPRTS